MNIGINSTYLAKEKKTGVENYSTEVILGLIRNDKNNHYSLFSPYQLNLNSNSANIQPEIFISPILRGWHTLRLPLELKKHPVDLFFDPGYTVPPFTSVPTIVTIHDLAYKFFPEAYSKKQIYLLNKAFRQIEKRAKGIIFTSQKTKDDFFNFYPHFSGKSIVLYQSINKNLFTNNLQSNSKFDQHQPYILSVGRLETRKNTFRLVKAYQILRRSHPEIKHKLILAGVPGYGYNDIKTAISCDKTISNDIIETGYLSTSDMPLLYSKADLFVFPSLYEGFGIPVLEAFASGVPVLTSNSSCLPEIAGKAAAYCNPQDAQDIATKIYEIISNKKYSDILIESSKKQLDKFDWDKHSISLINFFGEVYENCHSS